MPFNLVENHTSTVATATIFEFVAEVARERRIKKWKMMKDWLEGYFCLLKKKDQLFDKKILIFTEKDLIESNCKT